MSWGALLGTVAIRLATFTKTRGQEARAQIVDVGETGGELIPFIAKRF